MGLLKVTGKSLTTFSFDVAWSLITPSGSGSSTSPLTSYTNSPYSSDSKHTRQVCCSNTKGKKWRLSLALSPLLSVTLCLSHPKASGKARCFWVPWFSTLTRNSQVVLNIFSTSKSRTTFLYKSVLASIVLRGARVLTLVLRVKTSVDAYALPSLLLARIRFEYTGLAMLWVTLTGIWMVYPGSSRMFECWIWKLESPSSLAMYAMVFLLGFFSSIDLTFSSPSSVENSSVETGMNCGRVWYRYTQYRSMSLGSGSRMSSGAST
mmetsp:Transcript_8873/g.31981  ORF Transcript_8873/g.31981 Transcript_8873/m.31981 type:complete len:264 (+) Transcript_8873:3778-4569(+)